MYMYDFQLHSPGGKGTEMSNIRKHLFVIACYSLFFCSIVTARPFSQDMLDIAAKELGKKREELKVDATYKNTLRQAQHGLKLFEELMDAPFEAPKKVKEVTDKLSPSKNPDPGEIILYASKLLDSPVEGDLPKPVNSDKSGSERLLEAIEALFKLRNETFTGKSEVEGLLKDIPDALCDGISEILESIAIALPLIDKAFASVGTQEKAGFYKTGLRQPAGIPGNQQWDGIIGKVDLASLFKASAIVCGTVVKTGEKLEKAGKIKNRDGIKIKTPLGLIAVAYSSSDKHIFGEEDILLFIETGGNDIYSGTHIGANRSPANPISIVIDIDGNDQYASPATDSSFEFTQGAGVFGIGILADLDGTDKYEAGFSCQGCACFGVGLLFDDDRENDFYKCIGCGQGCGFAGAGILIDTDGEETYRSFINAQGYGATKGLGLLLDLKDDDKYILEDPTNGGGLKFPSEQNKEYSCSVGQGASLGWRGKAAGGIGVLSDLDGDDQYAAGVFAQGCSYYLGMGLLNDSDGNDSYRGCWYVQGVGCHVGFGMLLEREGKDKYWVKQNMSQGAGHDFSTGILLDAQGDDFYEIPNLSGGAGNDCGYGLFIDLKGNDTYISLGGKRNIGFAQQGKNFTGNTYGLFIDVYGKDKYPRIQHGNTKTWKSPSSLGLGFDHDHGRLKLW